ncbi:MAG: type II toxin-antitoxin system RelE/ParE family toxin [Burkholderiales bacterium]|nr:type II toxin-antitoxin system RelE/ParE family toxin [Burkholderiales bacterium]
MKPHKLRFTPEAEVDLLRLYEFLAVNDLASAERALTAIESALQMLALSPYSCRKVTSGDPVLRELLIPFGNAGYVALFEIERPATVTILAVRHQREDDYC